MMIPKFRAWHMPFGPKGPMQEMVHGKASSILAFSEMSPDKYIIEQFTGMKDLYGTEIYEGDIIKVQETLDNGRLVCLSALAKVYFDEDDGQWKCDGGFTGPLSEHANTASGSFINSMSDDYMPNRCEVIGNVHQNSELLEVDDE